MTFREQAAIAAMSALVRARSSSMAATVIRPGHIQELVADAWTIADALDRARPAGASSFGAAPSASGPAKQPGPYSEKPDA